MSYTYQKTIEYKFDAHFVSSVLKNKYYFSFSVPVDEYGNEISINLEKKIKQKIRKKLIELKIIESDQIADILLSSGSYGSAYHSMIPMIAYARWIEDVTVADDGFTYTKIKLFLE
jgi:hypothetical protein